jgi:hypothetical protein
MTGLEVGE